MKLWTLVCENWAHSMLFVMLQIRNEATVMKPWFGCDHGCVQSFQLVGARNSWISMYQMAVWCGWPYRKYKTRNKQWPPSPACLIPIFEMIILLGLTNIQVMPPLVAPTGVLSIHWQCHCTLLLTNLSGPDSIFDLTDVDCCTRWPFLSATEI